MTDLQRLYIRYTKKLAVMLNNKDTKDRHYGARPSKKEQRLKELIDDVTRAMAVEKGKVVYVKKLSRGKFPKPTARVGTVGYIVNVWCSSWGTLKCGMLTYSGDLVMTSVSCVDVVDRDPGDDWEIVRVRYERSQSLPVIGIVKKATKKAVLLLTTRGKDIWVPKRMIDPEEVKNVKVGSAITANMPLWMARKNGLTKQIG